MDKYEMAKKLLSCFPDSFITDRGEFIAHKKSNTYLIIEKCETWRDLSVAVIEWFSRPACFTSPYNTGAANAKFHSFMRDGINKFFGVQLTSDDMELIYIHLGNGVNHSLAVQFVESNCNMELLREYERSKLCRP